MQTRERQDRPPPTHPQPRCAPFPGTGVRAAGAKAADIKAGGSEIQGRGVAGGDKRWKRSLAREISIYLDIRQNYSEKPVK